MLLCEGRSDVGQFLGKAWCRVDWNSSLWGDDCESCMTVWEVGRTVSAPCIGSSRSTDCAISSSVSASSGSLNRCRFTSGNSFAPKHCSLSSSTNLLPDFEDAAGHEGTGTGGKGRCSYLGSSKSGIIEPSLRGRPCENTALTTTYWSPGSVLALPSS